MFMQISPEEEERRKLRRERNKLAAARCRKRRLDHTNELVEVFIIKFCIIYMHVCEIKMQFKGKLSNRN